MVKTYVGQLYDLFIVLYCIIILNYCIFIHMKSAEQNLFEIAESQQGFFTASQARKAGYRSTIHTYHVQKGNWIKECRGVFRLAQFPYSSQTQFVVAALWTMNRQGVIEGVYSKETALVLHDVSDANPNKLYMTVPKHFRRHSKSPYEIEFRKTILPEDSVILDRGFKVTTPLQTILDLIESDHVEDKILIQAIQEFYQRGLIGRTNINFSIKGLLRGHKHKNIMKALP